MTEHCFGWHENPEGHLANIPEGGVCEVCGKPPLRVDCPQGPHTHGRDL